MLICAAGDIHGAMDRLYADVLAFEVHLGRRFDWVLHVGDFGIWPDPSRVDRATRKHGDAGDFVSWLRARRPVPRRTLFIKGNHEDFDWLDAQHNREVLPDLFYLPNGRTFDLTTDDGGMLRVGGVGGCHGPSDYERRSQQLQGYAKRHYTRDETQRLSAADGVAIVLTHDAPAGVRFPRHHGGRGFVSRAEGLDAMLARLSPSVCFFGHHHTRIDAQIAGVRCIGLNKVAQPGNLVAIEIGSGRGDWMTVGEWAAPSMAP
jgi:predicted phosphodiesterase